MGYKLKYTFMNKILIAHNRLDTLRLYCETDKPNKDSYYWVEGDGKVLEEGKINGRVELYWDAMLLRCDNDGNIIKMNEVRS